MKNNLAIALILFFALIILLSIPIFAEENTAIISEEIAELLPSSDKVILDDCSNYSSWMPLRDSRIDNKNASGISSNCLHISSSTNTSLGIYRPLLSSAPIFHKELYMPYYLSASGTITLYIAFTTNTGTYSYVSELTCNQDSVFIFNIASLKGQIIQSITLEIIANTSSYISDFWINSLYYSTIHLFDIIKHQDILIIPADNASITFNNNSFTVSSSDKATSFRVIFTQLRNPEGYLRFKISSKGPGNHLSISYLDAVGNCDNIDTISILEGCQEYIIPVSEFTAAGFEVQLILKNESIIISDYSLYSCETTKQSISNAFGQITNCYFTGNNNQIEINGKVKPQCVTDHINNTISVYGTDKNGVIITPPLQTSAISTRFSFTINMNDYQNSPPNYYSVFIESTNNKYLIGIPTIPSVQAITSTKKSAIALYGATEAEQFLMNSPAFLMDIRIDDLLVTNKTTQNTKLLVYQGKVNSFNADYIKTLDQEISFYQSSDRPIYIRLLLSSAINTLSFTGSNGVFCALNASLNETNELLEAILSFIFSRYYPLDGIVLGYSLDNSTMNSANIRNLESYVESIYSSIFYINKYAHLYSPNAILFLPFELTERSNLEDSLLLITRLSSLLSRNGGIPYSFLYITSSANDSLSHLQSFISRLPSLDLSPQSYSVYVKLDSNSSLEEKDFTPSNLSSYSHVFYDISKMSGSVSRYSLLDYLSLDSSIEYRQTSIYQDNTLGSVILWDFSSSFDSMGWITDSTLSSPITESNQTMAEYLNKLKTRTLIIKADKIDTDSIAFGSLPSKLNLSYAPLISFTLIIKSSENANITIVFGNGKQHVEYSAILTPNVPATITCDLQGTSIASEVSFVSFVLSKSIDELQIASISANSTLYSSDELLPLLNASDGTNEASHSNMLLITTGITVFVITIMIFFTLLLSKKRHNIT